MDALTDGELKLVIKSLSITYDSLSKKMDRLRGRHLDDAVVEAELCNSLLDRYKSEQAQRWRNHAAS